MGYIDLIPDVFRLTMPDLATGKSYHTQKFNVGNKQCIGVTIKASQALSVSVAYGIASDTAAAAGVDIAASLPYKTSATSFASNTSTEGGTYHEIAVPPHARQAQLVISNASGSTVSGAVIDAALRVVAYPAASGSGSSDFASITGWPGSSSQFVHADGSYSPLSAADMPTGIDAAKIGGGAVSNTEFGYLDGVTSAIQTQLGTKAPVINLTSVGGTANAITATATGVTLAAGMIFAMAATLANSSTTVTVNINAAGAITVKLPDGTTGPAIGDIVANKMQFYEYDGTYLRLMSGRPIADGDLPSTSNNATISAISTVANAALPKAGGTMSQALQFSSGTALSGAAWGIYRSGTNLVFYSGDSNSYGQIGSPYQARVTLWGAAATYTGSIHEQARLITRANSTAYSICPVASTEVARILLQDDSSKRAVALVDASGTVTFESGSHADYVASSSPASGEVGCYVTGGVFTIKPGSAGTRKIAAICQLGAN